MQARLPREMVAAVQRGLSTPVGNGEIVAALNYASSHLADYYAWPWFLSEMTWTFRAPVTGTCSIVDGDVTLESVSDAGWTNYVDLNWRLQVGQHDYPIDAVSGGTVLFDTSKVRPIDVGTGTNYVLFHAALTLPADFKPGKDIACYNTTMRYRVRHMNRMAFERHWQAYKQMASNFPLVYCEREPLYDAVLGWRYQLQFCPRPVSGTQVKVAYYRSPEPVNLATNAPTEWPTGYDEILELLALGRLGELMGDMRAVLAGKRATGLIRQMRGMVATAVMDETPQQNAPYGAASWEEGGLSVLPRES